MKKPVCVIVSIFALIFNCSLAQSKDVIPRPPECGKNIEKRIITGNETDIDEFPWLAQIQYIKSDGEIIHLCVGSLVSSQHVITAGYCADQKSIPTGNRLSAVRLGDWNIETNPDCTTEDQFCAPKYIDVPVKDIFIHPEFNKKQKKFDMALLRLERPVEYNDFISPICLPVPTHLRNANHEGKVMFVAGWSRLSDNPIKYKLTVTGESMANCQKVFKEFNLELGDSHMCTNCVNGPGSAGGPLMVLDNSNPAQKYYYLAGTVSFGSTSCKSGVPDIYTRVGSLIDWIQEMIQA